MLKLRALSALALAPPALAAVWYGGYGFAALVALAAAIMCWEWGTIVTRRFDRAAQISAVICALASLAAVTVPHVAVGAVFGVAALAAILARDNAETPHPRQWAAAGALYAGLPSVALIWLRCDAEAGRSVLFWLLLLVWATDIGAYAAGRLIGGPLLAPSISPKKTWAGLLGGMISAALVGAAMSIIVGVASPLALAVLSAILAVIAQAGDFLESWVKRRWGVKDASNIIPGHGGVLDRVDGLLTASLVVAAFTWIGGRNVWNWNW